MKIGSCNLSPEIVSDRQRDLHELLRQPFDNELRPCKGCEEVCACAKRSRSCCCQCSAHCPSAGRILSNDGERYPIEPDVLPLVYALSALRIVEPCWSCEGHESSGSGVRKPQVWFYARSAAYPELLQRHVSHLANAGKLAARWEIVVSEYQPEACITLFVIRPEGSSDIDLAPLRKDLRTIGRELQAAMRNQAQKMLLELPAPR